MVERDHFLPDFRNRFFPTLSDFVQAMAVDEPENLTAQIEAFHCEFSDPEISRLLLSPIATTSKPKSLLVTHNSWFINTILPMLFGRNSVISNFDLTPDDVLGHMRYEQWMKNGEQPPPSAKNVLGIGYLEPIEPHG